MFSIRSTFHVLALALGVAFAPQSPALAQTQPTMAVIDVQKLMNESKAGVSLQTQLKATSEKFEEEIKKFDKELKDTEQMLVKERASLKPEEFTKKRDDFEQKLSDTRRQMQKKRGALTESFGEANATLQKKIVEIVGKIADEKKIDVVMSRQNVVIVDKKMDITAEVLEKLNAEMADVKVKIKE